MVARASVFPKWQPETVRKWTTCVALAAFVFAARAWLIQLGGSAIPFWDQWDGEALRLYKPWLTSTLSWNDLFAAHNEHRITLTRVADLILLTITGEWNPWHQMLLNAALHATTAAATSAMLWGAVPLHLRVGFPAGIGLLFAAPTDWHNALWGFQSVFYIGNILAVGAFAGLAFGSPSSGRWWSGVVMAALALFSSGEGLLISIAAIVALLVVAVFPGGRQSSRTTFAVMILVTLVGASLHVTVAGHDAGKAQSVAQFWTIVTRCLAWPHIENGLWCVAMQLPLLWLLVQTWRKRTAPDAALRFALMLVVLAALHTAAVAYSRGSAIPTQTPISRYFGPLMLAAAAQFFAACRLATSEGRPGRFILLGWTGGAAIGVLALTITTLTEHVPMLRALDAMSYAATRHYLLKPDAAALELETVPPMLHPNPMVVARVLDDPVLRPILPAALRLGREAPAAAPPWVVRNGHSLTIVATAVLLAALAFAHLRKPGPGSLAEFT